MPQAGNISNDKLDQHKAKFGYEPEPINPVFCRHLTQLLHFLLVVPDFDLQYERQADITDILNTHKNLQYL